MLTPLTAPPALNLKRVDIDGFMMDVFLSNPPPDCVCTRRLFDSVFEGTLKRRG
jgi:hypothetical protein